MGEGDYHQEQANKAPFNIRQQQVMRALCRCAGGEIPSGPAVLWGGGKMKGLRVEKKPDAIYK